MKIPTIYRSAAIEDFESSDISLVTKDELIRICASDLITTVNDGPSSVLITGSNGAGKSHLAAAIGRCWRSDWVNCLDLQLQIRNSFRANSEKSELSIIDSLCQDRSIIIDDMSSMNRTEHAAATMLAILTRRIESVKPTIVTMAWSLRELHDFDSAIASRISGFQHFRFGKDSQDRRRK